MNTPPHTAPPITVFAARMVRVGERAPRVTRRKDYGEDQTSHSRPSEQEGCMGVTTQEGCMGVTTHVEACERMRSDSSEHSILKIKLQTYSHHSSRPGPFQQKKTLYVSSRGTKHERSPEERSIRVLQDMSIIRCTLNAL